jgi:two-component system nitrogen regulation response regulator NtrX
MAELNKEPPALMILDIWLKDSRMDGIDILKIGQARQPRHPVVIISGHGNIEIAVAAIKQGAYDFIEKPFNIDQLMVVIPARWKPRACAARTPSCAQGGARRDDRRQLRRLQGAELQLDKVTKSNGRVMLTGPRGIGQGGRRALHPRPLRPRQGALRHGQFRRDRARPHGRGAVRPRTPERGVEQGLLEQAHGGVIYFDEVADMPPAPSPRSCACWWTSSSSASAGPTRCGGLRVISSTNRDLEAEIAAGRFREELYHRLNVVPITVPSLADRREDIPELAAHFIEPFNETQGLPRELARTRWRCCRRCLARQRAPAQERDRTGADPGRGRPARSRPDELPSGEKPGAGGGRVVLSASLATLPLREARELFEREYLLTQINRFGGNISRTAAFVGMERSALHRKLKSLGVVTSNKSGPWRKVAPEGRATRQADMRRPAHPSQIDARRTLPWLSPA